MYELPLIHSFYAFHAVIHLQPISPTYPHSFICLASHILTDLRMVCAKPYNSETQN